VEDDLGAGEEVRSLLAWFPAYFDRQAFAPEINSLDFLNSNDHAVRLPFGISSNGMVESMRVGIWEGLGDDNTGEAES
jgi:hypothetical protein